MHQVENAERADGNNGAGEADDGDNERRIIAVLRRRCHAWTRSIRLPRLVDGHLRVTGRSKVGRLHGLSKLTCTLRGYTSKALLWIARPLIGQSGNGLGGILVELALLLWAGRTHGWLVGVGG